MKHLGMKYRGFKFRGIVVMLVLALSLTGCSQKSDTIKYGADAATYLKELDEMGARVAGTASEVAGADYIESALTEMGYDVSRVAFEYDDSGMKKSENIIVEKKGTGDGTVIVGAHYDSMDSANGVDDNGSGVAVLLEAAKSISKAKPIQTVKFVFFGAEEVNLLGSDEYASQMSAEEIADTVLMINFDSLVAGDISYVYGNSDENGKYREHTLELAKLENLALVTQEGNNPEFERGITGPWSDHAPFEALGIPFIYFESTNWNYGEQDGYTQVEPKYGDSGEIWHTEYDTYAYIEKTFPGRIDDRLELFSTVLYKLLVQDLSDL